MTALDLSYLVRRALVLLLVVGCTPTIDAQRAQLPQTDEFLVSPCTLEKRWRGITPTRVWEVWLVCDESEFLLRKPSNLTGYVRIDSPARALAFLRLFTSDELFHAFDLDGALEVRPCPREESWTCELFEQLEERGVASAAVAEPMRESAPIEGFKVTQLVVDYDQNVYRMTTRVAKNGFTLGGERELIFEGIHALGFVHRYP